MSMDEAIVARYEAPPWWLRWTLALACSALFVVVYGAAGHWAGQAARPTADQASEIAQLRRENERLRMERDILKKSIAIFAGTRT